MKIKNIVLVTFGLLTAVSVFAKPMIPSSLVKNIPGFQNSSEVDFVKVNPLLQALTTEFISNEDQLMFAYPEFDTELSSIESERLVYRMKGRLENTRWGSNAEINASTDYQIHREPSNPGLSVSYQFTVKTKVLDLVHFTANTVKTKANGFMNADGGRHSPILDKAIQASQMKEVYQSLLDSQKEAVDEINRQLVEEQYYLSCSWNMNCGTVTVDAWGNRSPDRTSIAVLNLTVDQLRRTRTSFESLEITYSLDSDQITINAPAPQGFLARASGSMDNAEAKFTKVTLDQNQITSEGKVFVAVSTDRLDRLRNNLDSDLNGLVNNTPENVANIQNSFRVALMSFKNTINAANLR